MYFDDDRSMASPCVCHTCCLNCCSFIVVVFIEFFKSLSFGYQSPVAEYKGAASDAVGMQVGVMTEQRPLHNVPAVRLVGMDVPSADVILGAVNGEGDAAQVSVEHNDRVLGFDSYEAEHVLDG